ncbi:MAG: organic solvent tolerance protein [Bdellovibrio sp.]|nr:organic solvent tolerance protein [Bdellovibrio sp.]
MKMKSLTVALLAAFFSTTVFAKDLTHRFGLGIKNNTSQSLPSVAIVYHPTLDFAFTGGFGIDTKKDYSAFQLNAGVRKVIFTESNLNFYTGAQAGLVNFENPTDGKKSGFEIMALFGTEFFFAGLDNLAFTFEGGLGVASVKDVRFRTVADDPFRAGLIFYF